MIIESFEIKGLFNSKDVKITFKDETMILIGENGMGKTTILAILFYTITGQVKNLKNMILIL